MAKKAYRILGQGHLDGACFLYAIANAMLCLTRREIKSLPQKNWSEMIAFLNAGDFLDGRIGTKRTDDNADLQALLAHQCISSLDPSSKYEVKTKRDLDSLSNFDEIVTNDTVLLLPTLEHWYCLVDSKDTNAYLACSSKWHEPQAKYEEKESPRLHRVYNKKIALEKLEIYDERAIAVSRRSRGAKG